MSRKDGGEGVDGLEGMSVGWETVGEVGR